MTEQGSHLDRDKSKSAEPARVRIERDGDVAFIVIDNPPINAASVQVRQGIISALAELETDDRIKSAVLIGAGKTFVAGSDLKEFSAPLADPQVPAVISALETFPKPIVAALHGAALGGGFELALGCDARVATRDAFVGLPEVTFGIIPGAGGTVRLSRLTDAATALEIITSCRRVKAPEALSLSLIDAVAEDLRRDAAEFARSLGCKRRVREKAVVAFDRIALEAAAATARRERRNHPGIEEAIAAVMRSTTEGFEDALLQERSVFQHLRMTDASEALRHLFFAERRAGHVADFDAIESRPIETVGIVGAGTMGVGIAACFLSAGYTVRLVERHSEALASVGARLAEMVRSGSPASGTNNAFSASDRIDSLSGCDLVVEAVFEDMSVKTALLRSLGDVLRPGAIVASNTSYLDLNKLAGAARDPASVVGLHFFSPAHRMKLLEIVRAESTAADVMKTALSVGRKLGKISVVSGVGEGFIGNRIYNAYRLQCEVMIDQGATPKIIDEALEGLGFAMGPFAVGDLSGLDIAAANRRRRRAEGVEPSTNVSFLEQLVEEGRLGRKAGGGWYDYPAQAKRGIESQKVLRLLQDRRRTIGRTGHLPEAEEIRARAIAAIVNEAALVLAEGIAARASDIDLVWVHGYGFPARLGGPIHWAVRQPSEWLQSAAAQLAANPHTGFRQGDLGAFLPTTDTSGKPT